MRRVPERRVSRRQGCIWVVATGAVMLAGLAVCVALGVFGTMYLRRDGTSSDAAGPWSPAVEVFRPSRWNSMSPEPSPTPLPTLMPEMTETAPVVTEPAGGGDQTEEPVPASPTPVSVTLIEEAPDVGSISASEAQSDDQPLVGLPAHLPERPATRLVIPSLALDTRVVLLDLQNGTWDIEQLTQEVGHLRGTASPGDGSNVALAGHVTLSQGGDGPFRDLAQLRSGQEAIVYTSDESYTYVIESVKVVEPTDVTVTLPTDHPMLTLITCANWDNARHLYTDRIVAVGHLAQP